MLLHLFTGYNKGRNDHCNFKDDQPLPTASYTSLIKHLTVLQGSDHFPQKEMEDSHRLTERPKVT